jgi:hypothetical protein
VEWDDNHKSQAAKEILINVIAKSPLGLCDVLRKMARSYWWDAENEKRKTH